MLLTHMLLGLLAGFVEPESPPVHSQDVGPLRVRVEASRKRYALTDKIVLHLTIIGPEKVVVDPPSIKRGQEFGGCPVLDVHVEGPDVVDGPFGKLQVQNWMISLEPLALGPLELPPLTIGCREAGGAPIKGHVRLPRLEVLPGPSSSDDPSTLRPVPPLPPTPESTRGRLATILRWSGLGLLATATVWWLFGRRKPAGSPPLEAAMRALQNLDAAQLDDGRESVNQTCDVVRGYLNQAYSLHADRQTTPEFLHDPRTQEVLSADQRSALREFLESADASRFPAGGPDAETRRVCVRRARAFLAGEPAA